jgi:hypothetical protein
MKRPDYKYLLWKEFGVQVVGMTLKEMKKLYDELLEAQEKHEDLINSDVHDEIFQERVISF